VDVDAIVAGMAERDRWKARLAALERDLRTLRGHRARLEGQLARLLRELRRMEAISDQVLAVRGMPGGGGTISHEGTSAFRPIR
jgi:hypothetical protein